MTYNIHSATAVTQEHHCTQTPTADLTTLPTLQKAREITELINLPPSPCYTTPYTSPETFCFITEIQNLMLPELKQI